MATIEAASSGEKKRKYDGETKHVCLEINDFDDIIEENAAFVDKTMFIKEWMEKTGKVSVFLRPRRFGKSTNLSMLKSFFSFGAESKDFSRFFIGKETDFIEKHRGKYPVVSLDMTGIGGDNWGEMLSRIWSCLRETLNYQEENLNEQDVQFIGVDCNEATAQPNETIAAVFLRHLIFCLQQKYKQKVIVLIDDYDAPLNHAFRKGFYEKASSFFEEFYSNGLIDNCNLKRACLMGIVEFQGAGNLSGLNNLVSYTFNEDEFSQYFGFTAEEITAFLKEDREEIQGVMEWYNGYFIGSCQVINPWSFMSYIDKRILKSYWTRTANFDSIFSILSPETNLDLVTVLGDVYNANDYEIDELLTIKSNSEIGTVSSFLSFLVHTGYLTYKEGKVMIPNKEIRLEWRNYIFGLTSKNVMMPTTPLSFLNALNARSFNFERLEEEMRKYLNMCSSCDLQDENSYHAFYLGIFVPTYGPSKVKSNLESGHRRCNIAIEFEEGKKVVIFELKVSETEKELAKDADMGLKQILDKEYHKVGRYAGWTCFAIGVSFLKKQMSELKCKKLKH